MLTKSNSNFCKTLPDSLLFFRDSYGNYKFNCLLLAMTYFISLFKRVSFMLEVRSKRFIFCIPLIDEWMNLRPLNSILYRPIHHFKYNTNCFTVSFSQHYVTLTRLRSYQTVPPLLVFILLTTTNNIHNFSSISAAQRHLWQTYNYTISR